MLHFMAGRYDAKVPRTKLAVRQGLVKRKDFPFKRQKGPKTTHTLSCLRTYLSWRSKGLGIPSPCKAAEIPDLLEEFPGFFISGLILVCVDLPYRRIPKVSFFWFYSKPTPKRPTNLEMSTRKCVGNYWHSMCQPIVVHYTLIDV